MTDDFFFVTTIIALLIGAGTLVAYTHQKFTNAEASGKLRERIGVLETRVEAAREMRDQWRDRVADWERLYNEERRQRLAERAQLLAVPTPDGGVAYLDIDPPSVNEADVQAAMDARHRLAMRHEGREPVNVSDRDAPPTTRLDATDEDDPEGL